MHYYEVAVLGSALKPLTYHYGIQIPTNSLIKVSVQKNQKTAVVLKEVQKPVFQTLPIDETLNTKFSSIQIELANFISYYYTCEKGMSFNIFEPYDKQIYKNIGFNEFPNLTSRQTKARDFCLNNKVSLVFGDTGSGKSEIYISLIAKILNDGKQALFLMPEISLTPQMTKRLERYFKDHVGVWHSKISKKKKNEILLKLQNGDIKLIAGARSALFLPFTNLGLIIVDEEHDDSYKSNSKPRYNARDLAIFLSDKFDIKVVLGSATPSLTTYKKHKSFRLEGTFFKSEKTFIYDQNQTEISPTIVSEIKKTLNKNKQAIVFLPTRANFKYMICQTCQSVVKCPFCSVGMSYHKDKNALKCHYCGYTTFAQIPCSKCGGETMQAKKMGTSEALEILSKKFSKAKIAKFDKDEITTQKKLELLLKNFNDHKIDILVGTQMLSKGHDYHNVDLAVIMGIDDQLNYPDFRAREKTLSLAMQVAGRAGRAENGRVVIQTMQSEFFKEYIQNYDKFLQDEDEFRNPLYPPYTRLLRILISHKNNQKANQSLSQCLQRLKIIPEIQIIGYGKAAIEFMASKFRYEILIRSNSHKPLIKAALFCKDVANVEIDMDPVNFS